MGFDTSFHPVDVKLIHDRLLPYIRGEGSAGGGIGARPGGIGARPGGIDDLVARAVETAKVRFRANAYGNALVHYKMMASLPEGLDFPGAKPLPDDMKDALQGFESDLHVWGRPFFIVADSPAEVSKGIDRYLAATTKDVDAIAKEMLARFHPRLADMVEPNMEGNLPPDADLAKSIRWKMDLFRDAHAGLLAGKTTVRTGDGKELPIADLFARDLAHALLDFQSHFRPGWMSRGKCWPTLFARELIPFFETAASWVEPLKKTAKTAGAKLERSISENYMVGGYVPPESVTVLAQGFDANRLSLETQLKDEGWEEPDLGIALRKLDEAIFDASSRGLGFCEATEIYSAPMGIMN